jgi:hypothetical protein
MGDWGTSQDALAASCTAVAATLSVGDFTLYAKNFPIQIDSEIMYVTSATANPIAVTRGVRGSTAATHASGATILVKPAFFDMDYLDALNGAINASFPWVYAPVYDDTTTTTATAYEYTIPNLNGSPIPYISKLYFKETGDTAFRLFQSWEVLRGTTPVVKLRRPLPVGTLRFRGFGPIPQLASVADSLNSSYPTNIEDALTLYAAHILLASGESRRVRDDIGIRDDRENANRVGSSMTTSSNLLQRFQMRLRDSGMPPMPKHIVSVL